MKSLSEKRQDTNKGTNFIRYAYAEEDVKDKIKELKKAFRFDCEKKSIHCPTCEENDEIIDKIFGPKLTGGNDGKSL